MTERITRWADVRCASESGRRADIGGCRKCANSGREQTQQMASYSIYLVGARHDGQEIGRPFIAGDLRYFLESFRR